MQPVQLASGGIPADFWAASQSTLEEWVAYSTKVLGSSPGGDQKVIGTLALRGVQRAQETMICMH